VIVMVKQIKFSALKNEWMKDAEFRKQCHALAAEFTLTDEQAAEIERRRADPNRVLVSHSDARKRIKKLCEGGKPHSASS
jgi:hypothetical protein